MVLFAQLPHAVLPRAVPDSMQTVLVPHRVKGVAKHAEMGCTHQEELSQHVRIYNARQVRMVLSLLSMRLVIVKIVSKVSIHWVAKLCLACLRHVKQDSMRLRLKVPFRKKMGALTVHLEHTQKVETLINANLRNAQLGK